MVEGAKAGGVHVGAQLVGDAADGLAGAEPPLLRGEIEAGTAELARGDLERDARAQRGLLEQQRHGLAGERWSGRHSGGARPLQRERLRIEAVELRGRGVV